MAMKIVCAECLICGRMVRLKRNGRLAKHNRKTHKGSGECVGSGA